MNHRSLKHAFAEWAHQDAEEREAVRGMNPAPHYELNDGTCVSCGQPWPCDDAYRETP